MKSLRHFLLQYNLLVFVTLSSLSAHAQVLNHKRLLDSAEVATSKMNYQRALIFLDEAIDISKKTKNKAQIISDFLTIGRTHSSLDNKEKALEMHMNALRLSDELKNDSITFEVVNELSVYYLSIESFELAKKYINQSKKIADRVGYLDFQRRYFNTLGIYERRTKNFEASINAYKKSLEFIPAEQLDDKLNAYINLSTAYGYADDLETSYSYLLKAEKLNETMQNDFYSLVLCGQLGRTQLLMGKLSKAVEYYELGLEKSIQVKNSDMIERFNRELARAHSKLGNFKEAYNYYAAFVFELENSHERQNATAIAEMSAKYESEKKEQKIKSLEEQQKLKAEIHQAQMERRNLWIVLSLLVVMVTITIAFIVLKNQRNKQRLQIELVEKQKELAKQEAELIGQEAERNRLSRELHDGLGGTLASIKMRLSDQNNALIAPILEDLDSACQDVRDMSHSLSSSFVNEIDFHELLMKLTEDIRRRSTMTINLEFMPIDELNSLEPEKRHQSYRIIQELTNNVVKHANASKLTIGLMKNDDEVILLIEDNGIGFETNSKMSGIGLQNVRKRLENIAGHLEITSKLNEGTTFTLNFPFS